MKKSSDDVLGLEGEDEHERQEQRRYRNRSKARQKVLLEPGGSLMLVRKVVDLQQPADLLVLTNGGDIAGQLVGDGAAIGIGRGLACIKPQFI